MLLEAGRRLVSCVRRENTVASLKGHEFAARLPEVSKGEDAARVAAKMLQALVRRFVVAGRQMVTVASIGISVFPDDANDGGTLLSRANWAIYLA